MREQIGLAKQASAAVKQEARERAAAEKQATREIEAAARQIAKEQAAAAKQAGQIVKQEAKEKAAAEKQAAREIEAAARQAAKVQAQSQMSMLGKDARGIGNFLMPGGMSGMAQNLMWGAAGAAGFYGIESLATGAISAGREGAQRERQEEMFSGFAARAGQDANQIIAAVRKATGGTVTDFEIMGLATQVLASKFSAGRKDIAGDLGIMAAASRQFARTFTDENGNAMSSAETFSRLAKFVREGSKELVDQFGLDNQRLAKAMGVSVDGMAGAGMATERFSGLLKVLTEDLAPLGPISETTADKLEASAARMETAKGRMQKALAKPVADVTEFGADVTEEFAYGLPYGNRRSKINAIEEAQAKWRAINNFLPGGKTEDMNDAATRKQIVAMQMLERASSDVYAAQLTGAHWH